MLLDYAAVNSGRIDEWRLRDVKGRKEGRHIAEEDRREIYTVRMDRGRDRVQSDQGPFPPRRYPPAWRRPALLVPPTVC